ncbi:cyclophilin-like fold protein [Planococcus soli]|uniref:cyclophilin-like fold protein n=1 Tax=Planococcus soli TaxID=2666072 RepID=UPI001940CB88|nr:cyclophilin-like fold protein [Planococcus soli]
MKKRVLLLFIFIIAFGLSACSSSEIDEQNGEEPSSEMNEERDEANMESLLTLELQIGGEVFTARLYENDTTQAMVELLPLTIDMEDLHSNEKFYYLSHSLPTDSESPGVINAGDIMLYGDDCLVFFYENLTTSHNYTRLGYIEDVERFTQVIGESDVTVELDLARNDK